MMIDNQFITDELTFERHVSITFMSVNLLVIALGIFINAIIIHLYRRRKITQSLFNFFLINLGISNIIQSLGALPFIIYFHRSVEDLVSIQRDDLLCGLIRGQPVFWTGSFVTMHTICFMNIKFYHIIKNPLHREDNKRIFVYYIITFWLVDFALFAPNFLLFKYDKINGYCRRDEDKKGWNVGLYKGALLLFGLCIPLILMLVVYVLIIREFYIKSKLGDSTESPVKVKYRKKVVVFLGIVVCVDLLSYSPFGIVFLLTGITEVFGSPTDPRFDVRNMRILKLTIVPTFCAIPLKMSKCGMDSKSFLVASLSMVKVKGEAFQARKLCLMLVNLIML